MDFLSSLALGELSAAVRRGLSGFRDPSEDLELKFSRVLYHAIERFGTEYQLPCPVAHTFLARDDNIAQICASIHHETEALTPDALDPRGPPGGHVATSEDIASFLEVLEDEIRKDLLLAYIWFGKAERRRAAADPELLRRHTLNPWLTRLQVFGKSPGWLPEPGQVYQHRLPEGQTIRFSIVGEVLAAEYVFSDGAVAYSEIDVDGNLRRHSLPYPTHEYRVDYKESDVLSKRETPVPGSEVTRVDLELKWGRRASYILGSEGELLDYHVSGGWSFNHNGRTITPAPPKTQFG